MLITSIGEDCMAFHVFLYLLVVCLLLCLVLFWRLCWLHLQPSHSRAGAKRTALHRLLKPRCPDDCPACRLASTASSGAGPVPAPVRPWREMKSRRGAPKRVNTQGFACPNRKCLYFGITDASIHALVGDGKHGQAERIQTFRCQACRTTFTSRRNTPLYRLKTPSQQVAQVLWLWLLIDPCTEDSARAPSRSPHAKRCAYRRPLPATHLGPWLSPALHE